MGIYEELNMHQPSTHDQQRKQQEEFRVTTFLAACRLKYYGVKELILTESKVPSFYKVYSKIQRLSTTCGNSTSTTPRDRTVYTTSGGSRGEFTFRDRGRGDFRRG